MAMLGPFPEPSPDALAWGVVMEMAYPGFSGTLSAFTNGQTNLHTSDGSGVPGVEINEQVRQASAKLIAAANKAIPYLKPTASAPLPEPWQAHFYVRTDSGNLVTKATAGDFRNEEHPLFLLFAAGNELLTEVKLVATERHKNHARDRIAGLTEAIAQNPKGEDYALRGEYYIDLGEFEKARADFESFLTLMPVADAFLGRGCFYMKQGDLTSALADFNHAIEMEPTNAMAYSNRGSAYSKLGDMEKALASYDLAIQHNPNYATAYTNRAFGYYKVGRYKEGIADCNRALGLQPEVANTYNNRGLCRAALGDKEGARADFLRALEMESKPASVIEESLNGLHNLDHPGEPLPVWQSPNVWIVHS
jgi:tetratricopeptide (TPR) repeat protein